MNAKAKKKTRTIKQMKLASYRASERKNRNDPAQNWCCNETHKETRFKNHAARRRTNKKKLHSQLAIANSESCILLVNRRRTKSVKSTKERNENKSYVQSRTQAKQNSESCILLVSRRRTKSVKSKPNNIISRLYISTSKTGTIERARKKLATATQPYVRTQLAIATVSAKASKMKSPKTGTIERARKKTDLTSKDVIRLSGQFINSR